MGATVDFGLFWLYVMLLISLFPIVLRVMFILDDEHTQRVRPPKLDISPLESCAWPITRMRGGF